MATNDEWFLTRDERGNDATRIDDRQDGDAWTRGNHVEVLVDGATYFRPLHEVLCGLQRDDWIHFTDWEGDADERLDGAGTEVGEVLCDLARGASTYAGSSGGHIPVRHTSGSRATCASPNR